MTSPLAKLISVAEAAIIPDPLDVRGNYARHTSLHSPANMLKYHKAVEELRKASYQYLNAQLGCAHCTPENECYQDCLDHIIETEKALTSALANFNQTLEEITK